MPPGERKVLKGLVSLGIVGQFDTQITVKKGLLEGDIEGVEITIYRIMPIAVDLMVKVEDVTIL